jgi:hypothetical protein
MPEPTLNDVMAAYAQDAVDFARNNFNVELDYTNQSIERVEGIAARLYDAKPKGFLAKVFRKGPTDEQVQGICKALGGDIGEVYRRSKGGDWAINQELDALGVLFSETWIFPPAKVYKRLANGPEDNLWIYFRVMLEDRANSDEADD